MLNITNIYKKKYSQGISVAFLTLSVVFLVLTLIAILSKFAHT